ncbi:hypothetical protein ABZY31_03685 [Streptomyces sp. NPDC006529]|uniref:hypothetical protein n=1 Tax=Streptomyces sp. NPDC006529 TaxID=3157177 RepID=UPI0033BB392A
MATNFEGHSHQELLAMLAPVNAETVKSRGELLQTAADTITKIGNDLKNYRVAGWEGKAARDFEEWVNTAGNSTLKLGDYSKTGGKWMIQAAQTIVEVKASMPKYDAAAADNYEAAKKYHNDPDSREIGQKAFTKLSGDHQEAVQQMTKLAQSYEASTTQMNAAVPPTFPPPPASFVPTGDRSGYSVDIQRPGSDTSRTGSTGDAYVPSERGSTESSSDKGHVATHQQVQDNTLPSKPAPDSGQTHVPTVPDRDVNVDLNTVGTLPDRPGTQLPGVPTGVGPGGPTGVGPAGSLPPLTLPPIGGMKSPGNGIGGAGGGRSPISGVGPGGGFPNTSGPGGKVGGIAGLPPREAGITGGRPVSASGPKSSIPRGTVIGNEGGMTGRGMAGGMAGAGGTGGVGGQGSSAAGRRLASEPGGVVGGRQPGAGGRSTTGGKPFTQGGSGLVRNQGGGAAGGVGGAMGHGGAGARTGGKKRNDQSGERPDYLAEDEETWQGNRRVVPPVID